MLPEASYPHVPGTVESQKAAIFSSALGVYHAERSFLDDVRLFAAGDGVVRRLLMSYGRWCWLVDVPAQGRQTSGAALGQVWDRNTSIMRAGGLAV